MITASNKKKQDLNRHWALVLVAGLFEISWVIGLKHANGLLAWTLTVIAIMLSMYLLILSTRKLPTGTAYAVFTGIGTSGTVLIEMLVFNEPVKPLKLILIAILVCGVVGLKTVTTDRQAMEVR